MSCSRLSILRVLFRDLQNNSNNNNIKNRQEKLSKIQFLKTYYIVENHKQDNKNSNNNLILQHDWKTWHDIITTNESMLE